MGRSDVTDVKPARLVIPLVQTSRTECICYRLPQATLTHLEISGNHFDAVPDRAIFFFFLVFLEPRIQLYTKSMSLKYEPFPEPLRISVKVPPSHPRECNSSIALGAMKVATQSITCMAHL
jgi:hypothetical protein